MDPAAVIGWLIFSAATMQVPLKVLMKRYSFVFLLGMFNCTKGAQRGTKSFLSVRNGFKTQFHFKVRRQYHAAERLKILLGFWSYFLKESNMHADRDATFGLSAQR